MGGWVGGCVVQAIVNPNVVTAGEGANTLQHTAAHCNTLQHAATHCI